MQEQAPHFITIVATAAGVILTALGAKFWDNIKEIFLGFFALFGGRKSKDLEYLKKKNTIQAEKLHKSEVTLNIKQERIIELERRLFELENNLSVIVFAVEESDDIEQIRKFATKFSAQNNITPAEM